MLHGAFNYGIPYVIRRETISAISNRYACYGSDDVFRLKTQTRVPFGRGVTIFAIKMQHADEYYYTMKNHITRKVKRVSS